MGHDTETFLHATAGPIDAGPPYPIYNQGFQTKVRSQGGKAVQSAFGRQRRPRAPALTYCPIERAVYKYVGLR